MKIMKRLFLSYLLLQFCLPIAGQDKTVTIDFDKKVSMKQATIFQGSTHQNTIDMKENGILIITSKATNLVAHRYDSELNLLWRKELGENTRKTTVLNANMGFNLNYRAVFSENGENIYLYNDNYNSIYHLDKNGNLREINPEAPKGMIAFNVSVEGDKLNILYGKIKNWRRGSGLHSKKKSEAIKRVTIGLDSKVETQDILMPVPEHMKDYMDYWRPLTFLKKNIIMYRYCSPKKEDTYFEILCINNKSETTIHKLNLPESFKKMTEGSMGSKQRYFFDKESSIIYIPYVFNEGEKLQLTSFNMLDGKHFWSKEYVLEKPIIKSGKNWIYSAQIFENNNVICQINQSNSGGVQSYLISKNNGELFNKSQIEYKTKAGTAHYSFVNLNYSKVILNPNGKAKDLPQLKHMPPEGTEKLKNSNYNYYTSSKGEIICFYHLDNSLNVENIKMYYFKK